MSDKSGHFLSSLERHVELEAGWYKGWQCENVYGWEYHGPACPIPCLSWRNLIVLNYQPSRAERIEIQERFKDAIAPDGTTGLSYDEQLNGPRATAAG